MYQLRGSRNIDLQWYLGGGNHIFLKKGKSRIALSLKCYILTKSESFMLAWTAGWLLYSLPVKLAFSMLKSVSVCCYRRSLVLRALFAVIFSCLDFAFVSRFSSSRDVEIVDLILGLSPQASRKSIRTVSTEQLQLYRLNKSHYNTVTDLRYVSAPG